MSKLIECVPNFSEGRNMEIINKIVAEITSVEGVKLLNVDPGKATNRTVVTFVGEPEAVVEAAFKGIKMAGELIDMSSHTGAHPRMGATDVCPLIPVAGISMEETIEYAVKLAKRVGEELKIPVYLYEAAQADKSRSNLSVIRAGEYEGFAEKMNLAIWKPDFGPATFDIKRGATVIGARDFLVAYNINLNTTSVRRANSVAFDVREAGRVKREGDPVNGKIVRDENGDPVSIPGTLKSVKAIGWYIEEYGIAQISMNLTNINITPVHIAFDEVCKKANERGMRVTGSELVGLIPLKALTDAGKYFLKKQKRSAGVSERELIKIAVKSLGLDDLAPFNPNEKIIEYLLEDKNSSRLVNTTLKDFSEETASESPAPGGGSISAYLGTLGISLGVMVANLSAHKKGWDARWEEFSDLAEKGEELRKQLLKMVDEDTSAFNKIMSAMALPKTSEKEKEVRKNELESATLNAIEVPFKVMQLSTQAMPLLKTIAESGNPNSVSDAGVGALCAKAAVFGAFLNVRINSGDLKDHPKVIKILKEGEELCSSAELLEKEILVIVNNKIGS
ncbi:MAG: glutamate formimidoyltransferase [Bacteroidetes bacterium]|nr:glutamate formimidoyltransferase [Bacteroidota bacterium]